MRVNTETFCGSLIYPMILKNKTSIQKIKLKPLSIFNIKKVSTKLEISIPEKVF